jgi:hypothetical protein
MGGAAAIGLGSEPATTERSVVKGMAHPFG